MLGLFSCCCVVAVAGVGIWVGAKYFFRVKTVYVLREIKQEESDEIEHDDNSVGGEQIFGNTSATTLLR